MSSTCLLHPDSHLQSEQTCEDIRHRCLVKATPSTQQWSRLNVGTRKQYRDGC